MVPDWVIPDWHSLFMRSFGSKNTQIVLVVILTFIWQISNLLVILLPYDPYLILSKLSLLALHDLLNPSSVKLSSFFIMNFFLQFLMFFNHVLWLVLESLTGPGPLSLALMLSQNVFARRNLNFSCVKLLLACFSFSFGLCRVSVLHMMHTISLTLMNGQI